MNSDFTSKDTSLWSSGICTVLIMSIKSLVDCTLCRDSLVSGCSIVVIIVVVVVVVVVVSIIIIVIIFFLSARKKVSKETTDISETNNGRLPNSTTV